jgi:hypothetical protein
MKASRRVLRDWKDMAPTAWYKAIRHLAIKDDLYLLIACIDETTLQCAKHFNVSVETIRNKLISIHKQLKPLMARYLNGESK